MMKLLKNLIYNNSKVILLVGYIIYSLSYITYLTCLSTIAMSREIISVWHNLSLEWLLLNIGIILLYGKLTREVKELAFVSYTNILFTIAIITLHKLCVILQPYTVLIWFIILNLLILYIVFRKKRY